MIMKRWKSIIKIKFTTRLQQILYAVITYE
jgi:hypothetical protein